MQRYSSKIAHTKQSNVEEQQINKDTDNQRSEADSAESKAPDAEKEINLLCQVAIEKLEVDADAAKQKSFEI
jgi:hypothetical protein